LPAEPAGPRKALAGGDKEDNNIARISANLPKCRQATAEIPALLERPTWTRVALADPTFVGRVGRKLGGRRRGRSARHFAPAAAAFS
jgi:hypothetical protein